MKGIDVVLASAVGPAASMSMGSHGGSGHECRRVILLACRNSECASGHRSRVAFEAARARSPSAVMPAKAGIQQRAITWFEAETVPLASSAEDWIVRFRGRSS